MARMKEVYLRIQELYPEKAELLIAEFNRHVNNEQYECPPEVEQIIDELNERANK